MTLLKYAAIFLDPNKFINNLSPSLQTKEGQTKAKMAVNLASATSQSHHLYNNLHLIYEKEKKNRTTLCSNEDVQKRDMLVMLYASTCCGADHRLIDWPRFIIKRASLSWEKQLEPQETTNQVASPLSLIN